MHLMNKNTMSWQVCAVVGMTYRQYKKQTCFLSVFFITNSFRTSSYNVENKVQLKYAFFPSWLLWPAEMSESSAATIIVLVYCYFKPRLLDPKGLYLYKLVYVNIQKFILKQSEYNWLGLCENRFKRTSFVSKICQTKNKASYATVIWKLFGITMFLYTQ